LNLPRRAWPPRLMKLAEHATSLFDWWCGHAYWQVGLEQESVDETHIAEFIRFRWK